MKAAPPAAKARADVHQLTEVLGALVPTAARSFGDLTYCSPMQQPGVIRRRRLDWFAASSEMLQHVKPDSIRTIQPWVDGVDHATIALSFEVSDAAAPARHSPASTRATTHSTAASSLTDFLSPPSSTSTATVTFPTSCTMLYVTSR